MKKIDDPEVAAVMREHSGTDKQLPIEDMNDNEKLIHLTVLLKTELTQENIMALKKQVEKCQKSEDRDDSFKERSWYLALTAMTTASSLLSAIDRIQKPERKKTHNAPFVEKRTR